MSISSSVDYVTNVVFYETINQCNVMENIT